MVFVHLLFSPLAVALIHLRQVLHQTLDRASKAVSHSFAADFLTGNVKPILGAGQHQCHSMKVGVGVFFKRAGFVAYGQPDIVGGKIRGGMLLWLVFLEVIHLFSNSQPFLIRLADVINES